MAFRLGTNDYNTLNASLDEDEYGLPVGLTGTAVDVGGYLGSVGIALAMDNPDLRVVIVEPVPPNGDLIERNIALNGVGDRVTLIRGAVGVGGEPVDVWYGYRGSESLEHHAFVGNSSLAYDHGGEAVHDSVTYPALALGSLIPPEGLALLKIDCEGGEWPFLASPDLARVAQVKGEWHPVRGHTQSDMAALFAPTHDVWFTGPDAGPGGFLAVLR